MPDIPLKTPQGWTPIEGATVLVIDDEEATRDVLADILETYGASVLRAENGSVGIAQYEQNKGKVGLVILDLSMPGLSGVEVSAKLREMNPQARIIMSSGYTEEDVKSRFPSLRCNGFIQKPYRPSALQSLVNRVLGE
jgi:two-component system, cell cycle sensor histidine kinase and response regulator CckA